MLPLKNAPTSDLIAYRDRMVTIITRLNNVEHEKTKLTTEAHIDLVDAAHMLRIDLAAIREELKVRARMMPDALAAD